MSQEEVQEVHYFNEKPEKDKTTYVVKSKTKIKRIEADLCFKDWYHKNQPKPSDVPKSIEILFEEWNPPKF